MHSCLQALVHEPPQDLPWGPHFPGWGRPGGSGEGDSLPVGGYELPEAPGMGLSPETMI